MNAFEYGFFDELNKLAGESVTSREGSPGYYGGRSSNRGIYDEEWLRNYNKRLLEKYPEMYTQTKYSPDEYVMRRQMEDSFARRGVGAI